MAATALDHADIAIHRVGAGNAHLLDRVDGDVFDHPVQPDLLQAFLANPANLLVVAVHQGEVIGMASGIAYVHPDKPLQLFVNEVGVSARFHRNRVGTRLVEALLEQGRELGCADAWVATEVGNAPARGLYAAVGGKEDDDQAVVYLFALGDRGAQARDGDG
ncbi:MAG TPA: GNAT family N-acetyltransferase [Xanthomonadaceae bacterium]|nr:GNAT family N-acetyltransferase [Xanthomonadaceae bacterium]